MAGPSLNPNRPARVGAVGTTASAESGPVPPKHEPPVDQAGAAQRATRQREPPRPRPSQPALRATKTSGEDIEGLRADWPAAMRARLTVTRVPANGNRPVAVYAAPDLDPAKPIRLVTLFHGHGWDVGSALERHGVFPRMTAECERDPQTVFVLPQATRRTPFEGWMKNPESFEAVREHALAQAAEIVGAPLTVDRQVLNAHSGGGLAIANVLRRQRGESSDEWQDRLATVDLGAKVNLLDATYGDWGTLVTRWAIARRRAGFEASVESWYTRHSKMVPHNQQMETIARGAGLSDTVATHDVTGTHRHNGVVAAFLGSD